MTSLSNSNLEKIQELLVVHLRFMIHKLMFAHAAIIIDLIKGMWWDHFILGILMMSPMQCPTYDILF